MAEKSMHGISCVLSWKTSREFWRKSISCLPRTHFPKQNAGTRYSVGVLDEIQMLGDETRGWAWTRTLRKKTTEAFQFVYTETHHFAKTGSGHT